MGEVTEAKTCLYSTYFGFNGCFHGKPWLAGFQHFSFSTCSDEDIWR